MPLSSQAPCHRCIPLDFTWLRLAEGSTGHEFNQKEVEYLEKMKNDAAMTRIFRDFPLGQIHPQAMSAAVAANCAAQGGFCDLLGFVSTEIVGHAVFHGSPLVMSGRQASR